eukprot:CAMPEP_0181320048 /NCGR_PEP_ID=MMETSP1101-20121128/17907_1 /TAXON_ID=46948 /ORGANISM="Rhodomonas abbreviata, Strain Caron Lab Isolate" /LENGTH=441 /DNA_ID=CAMNT_0023427709 /DNA_START=890 /DNA_END=2212 /DNA_ORIENTATION=-
MTPTSPGKTDAIHCLITRLQPKEQGCGVLLWASTRHAAGNPAQVQQVGSESGNGGGSTSTASFLFPLQITAVSARSEAETSGLRVEDQVVALKCPGGDFIDVVCGEHKTCGENGERQQFVQREVTAILLSGGECTLRVKRSGTACAGCGEHGLEEVEDKFDHALVCTRCGLVAQSSLMCTEAEWRIFEGDEGKDKARTGRIASLLDDNQRSTHLEGTRIEGGGRSAPHHMLVNAGRRLEDGKEKRKIAVEMEIKSRISNVCSRMDLTGGIEQASCDVLSRFLAAYGRKLCRNRDAVAAGCVFVGCKELGVHRTLKEMLNERVSGSAPKQTKDAIKAIEKVVGTRHKPVRAADLLPRFCSNLRLDAAAENTAAAELNTAPTELIAGHQPTSVAAAAIARSLRLSATRVSEATGAAASTISALMREWREREDKDHAPCVVGWA